MALTSSIARALRKRVARWTPLFSPTDVSSSAIRAVAAPRHANERVEKTFLLTKRPSDDHNTCARRLQIHAPGLTVVRVAPQLLQDIGPDAVARVRVTSNDEAHIERLSVAALDEHELEIQYDHPEPGTAGHLVTEVFVLHAASLERVIVTGRGDVVLDVDAKTPMLAVETGLTARHGARLFLDAADSVLELDDLVLTTYGPSHVYAATNALTLVNELFMQTLGRGTISVQSQDLKSHRVDASALGDGKISVHADRALRLRDLFVSQSGRNGAVRVRAAADAVVQSCDRQDLNVCGGTVDVADMASDVTEVSFLLSSRGVARIMSPRQKLSLDGGRHVGRAAVQHTGRLPLRVETEGSSVPAETFVTEITTTDLDDGREKSEDATPVIPTIHDAFETPAALDAPRDGWGDAVVWATLRSYLP